MRRSLIEQHGCLSHVMGLYR